MNSPPDAVAPPPSSALTPIGHPPGSHDYLFVVGFFSTALFLVTITYASYTCRHSHSAPSPPPPTATDDPDNDDVVITFPTFVYSDTTTPQKSSSSFDTATDVGDDSGCSICLEDYEAADVVRLFPECGHLFHVGCIDMWLKTHLTCPVCRSFAGGN